MFSELLKMLRDEKGWTQEELAEISGVSLVSINRYEKGTRKNPGLTELRKLCKAFNVSLDFLTGISDERRPLNKNDMDGIFLSLNDENRKKVIEYAKFILQNQEGKK
jgi:transcriptional regulator with XRE-family HTH domain